MPRPTRPRAARLSLAAVALVLVLAGCGGTPPAPSAASSTTAPTAASPSSTTTAATTTSSPPAEPTSAMGKRCGAPDMTSTVSTLAGPDGARLAVSSVGSGPTVALLLHQTDAVASCGWWPFATRLAAAGGVRAVMMDFCRSGLSRCDDQSAFGDDYVAQVALVVRSVRAQGARQVVLVGASLGGTVAVVSAAKVGADAVVDLSGFGYGPLVTAPSVRSMPVPLLAAGSPDDGTDTARLQAEVKASAAPVKRFVAVPAGHGWSMVLDGPFADSPVSPLGATVIDWVKGTRTAG